MIYVGEGLQEDCRRVEKAEGAFQVEDGLNTVALNGVVASLTQITPSAPLDCHATEQRRQSITIREPARISGSGIKGRAA